MSNCITAANQFISPGNVLDVREFGSGNINDTYLVTMDSKETKHFVLQRVNTRVFSHPELVMQNMRIVSDHVSKRLRHDPPADKQRWEIPDVFLGHDGQDHWVDSDGSFWRAMSYIDNAQSFDIINDNHHAEEVGNALGMFHNLISDLSAEKLVDTLEGFHIAPFYLQHYNQVSAKQRIEHSAEVDYCIKFVSNRSSWAQVLENAKSKGTLVLRPIHGDPKINNFMIDPAGHAIGIVDLDTVKPGLVHYDIGDCLRSGCNPRGEETQEPITFNTDICRAILKGYIVIARGFLTENDYDYVYDAIRLIAFELGLRFFTDYLEGNVYFKVRHPEHNLERALVQFQLTESIESKEADIRSIVKDIK